jgi:hypothetical protein
LDPWSLNEGQRPKSGKLKLHDVILGGKSIGSNQKKKAQRLQKLMVWRTKM